MAAARFIRFFSRRQAKNQPTALNDDNNNNNHHNNGKFRPSLLNSNGKIHSINKHQPNNISIKNGLVCTIVLLDGDDVNFEVDRKALGKVLYDKVIAHTKLIEPDYFALQFTDTHNVKQWLDPTKPIKKQCKIGPPYTFRFRVKFYTSDPQNLHDELTRYLFVLQLKDDIRTGKLDCPVGPDVELAALAIQAELGDYSSGEHTVETISELRFLPDDHQTEQFEEQVLNKWITLKGLTPADCEIQYLNKARWLEMYGVDLHTVMGKDGLEYKLGLTPTGILVFENRIKIGLFVWSKVTRIDFNRNKLTIVVVEDDDNDPTLQRDFVFLFRCYDERQCKHFWKCSMEYHIFFRTTSAAKVKQGPKSNFARTGSRFRFSGRTECQATTLGNLTRRSVNFERKASQRFSRRASYAIRKKIQEQELLREQEDERLKRLKQEQESKLEENKRSPEKSQETQSLTKRSSSQRNLSLSPTQRLDNLIQASTNDLLVEDNESQTQSNSLPRPPPIPPRQTKPDEKLITPPIPTFISTKQSNPTASNETNTVNNTKETSNDAHDQPLLIQMSPHKTTNGSNNTVVPSSNGKVNSPPIRYTLANSQSPYVVKETFFYPESTTVNSTPNNQPNSSIPIAVSPAPVIVTRTLSTSNVRNASATILQTAITTLTNGSVSCSTSVPHVYPRTPNRNLVSPSVGGGPHPITTEL